MTKDWMLLVPRKADKSGPIGVNAVGFCGSIFVKTEEDARYVEQVGPLHVLKDVCFSL